MRPERALGAVDRDLKVAPRRRLEVIEELGADAEALQEELERRGYHPGAARRSALRRVLPSRDTLAELEARHAPRLGRWVGEAGLAGSIERLGAIATATLAGTALLAVILLQDPDAASTLLAWSQVVVVALLSSNWTRAAKRLWIDGDLRPRARRVLWARHVGLIVAALSLGGLGATWEGYVALGAFEASSGAVWSAVQRAVFFAALGFGGAVFGLLGWLALIPRLVTDEDCERRIAALVGHSICFRSLPTRERRQ